MYFLPSKPSVRTSSLPLGKMTLTFLAYCAALTRPLESTVRPAACSEFSTSVVIFPSGSNLSTPPLPVTSTVPSGMPTPASEPRSPEATISIFVPAFTTPGMSGVTLSVDGCTASCPPRPPRLHAAARIRAPQSGSDDFDLCSSFHDARNVRRYLVGRRLHGFLSAAAALSSLTALRLRQHRCTAREADDHEQRCSRYHCVPPRMKHSR